LGRIGVSGQTSRITTASREGTVEESRYPYLSEREELIVTGRERGISVLDLAIDLHFSPTRVRQLDQRARKRIASTALPIPSPLTKAWPFLWINTRGDQLFLIRKALFDHYSKNPLAPALEVSLSLGAIHPGAIPGVGEQAVTLLYSFFGHTEPSRPPYHQVLAARKS
jgi:hypothetical protein